MNDNNVRTLARELLNYLIVCEDEVKTDIISKVRVMKYFSLYSVYIQCEGESLN